MNKKKHTILKRRLGLLLIIPFFFLFGCNLNDPSPDVNIPPAPKVRESVVPSFREVKGGIDRTIQENVKLDEKIDQQKQEILNQKLAIGDALAKAEKVKERAIAKQLITEIEAIDLIDSIKLIQTRNLFLETKINELVEIRKNQDIILKNTKDSASKTYDKLLAKEQEVDELRIQNEFLSKGLTEKNKEVSKLLKELEKEKVKSAKASVYRNWIFGIVGAFVLWIIVKNILMVYFPTTRFRI